MNEDIFYEVFLNISARDIINSFPQSIYDDFLWKLLIERDFPERKDIKDNYFENYKHLFILSNISKKVKIYAIQVETLELLIDIMFKFNVRVSDNDDLCYGTYAPVISVLLDVLSSDIVELLDILHLFQERYDDEVSRYINDLGVDFLLQNYKNLDQICNKSRWYVKDGKFFKMDGDTYLCSIIPQLLDIYIEEMDNGVDPSEDPSFLGKIDNIGYDRAIRILKSLQ